MRIKLKMTLPVAPEHGLVKGRELEVVGYNPHSGRSGVRWQVMGDAGEVVGVLSHEALEIIEGGQR